ncbi:MAG: hypothetical protein HOL99_12715 [Halieaceae bacterium]|jgi:hypothetical protein|nr:hypothetical protein [Halieaceae bacterium]
MELDEVLKELVRLKNELDENGKIDRWSVQRELIVTMLESYQMQLEYEDARGAGLSKEPIKWLGGTLDEDTRRLIKEAYAVNSQINERLREIEEGK